MVIDTFGFSAKALSFGAFDGVPITSSCPFQWNQMGTTLGVPSVHTYANRAGIFDCRSSFDTGCCKSSSPPLFDWHNSSCCLVGQTRARCEMWFRNSVDSAPLRAKGQEERMVRREDGQERIVRISQSGCYTP